MRDCWQAVCGSTHASARRIQVPVYSISTHCTQCTGTTYSPTHMHTTGAGCAALPVQIPEVWCFVAEMLVCSGTGYPVLHFGSLVCRSSSRKYGAMHHVLTAWLLLGLALPLAHSFVPVLLQNKNRGSVALLFCVLVEALLLCGNHISHKVKRSDHDSPGLLMTVPVPAQVIQ